MRSTYLTARKNILQRINNTQDIKHDSVEISRLINIIKFDMSLVAAGVSYHSSMKPFYGGNRVETPRLNSLGLDLDIS